MFSMLVFMCRDPGDTMGKVSCCVEPCYAWDTPGQPSAVWSVWRDSGTTQLFSCVGSFWNHTDVVCSDSTCEVWEGWLSAVGAIGLSDWLCASKSARCVGGAEHCALCFSMHSVPLFLVLIFWSTGVQRLPLWRRLTASHTGAGRSRCCGTDSTTVCSVELLCQTGQTRGSRVVG